MTFRKLLLNEFLVGRRMAEMLSVLRQNIRQLESEHFAKLRDNQGLDSTYSLSRQSDTLVRIGQLREWANVLSGQHREE
jgi:hypothetical protein